jgi:4-hydroxysphinganine ceramide fatty acyl 2-hydroxylase
MMDIYDFAQLQLHNTLDDAWIAFQGSVYDITDYLEEETHPGGIVLLQDYLGKDISSVFVDPNVHNHSEKAFELLEFYKIGLINYNLH